MVKNVNNTEKSLCTAYGKIIRMNYAGFNMELYGNDAMYAELCEQMHEYYLKRSTELKKMRY